MSDHGQSKGWPGVEVDLRPDGTYSIERYRFVIPLDGPIERVYESDGETDDALIARLEAEVERLKRIEQAAREMSENWRVASEIDGDITCIHCDETQYGREPEHHTTNCPLVSLRAALAEKAPA